MIYLICESVGVYMQVNAISSNTGFTSKRDDMIVQDDNYIRMLAYKKTLRKTNPEKNRKVTNAMFYSIPVVAGLSAAILTKGKATLLTKELSGKAAKLANGLKTGAAWGATLALADVLIGGKNVLSNKSEKFRDFERKNPVLTFFGTLGAAVAALCYAPKGISKLVSKIKPATLEKITAKIGRTGEKINKSKTLENLAKPFRSLAKKTPSALKELGKTVTAWAPDALLIGTLLHSLSSSYRANNEFSKNYSTLKEKQLNIAKMRARELQMENDFLKQFPENDANLEMIKDAAQNRTDEVLAALAEQYPYSADEV